MSGSPVFYMGDNGEVLSWDGQMVIKPGVNYCVTIGDGPTDYPDTPAGTIPGSIDYDIGYAQALRDVLAEIVASGKQNLVQWLEGRLKDLP